MTTVDLRTDGPPDPEYVLKVAGALAEAVRTLNHLTLDHAALGNPGHADHLIREIALAASRLPQLLDQIGKWLKQEEAAGRLRITGGPYASDPGTGFTVMHMGLEDAVVAAAQLHSDLEAAAGVTWNLAAADTGEDGSDG